MRLAPRGNPSVAVVGGSSTAGGIAGSDAKHSSTRRRFSLFGLGSRRRNSSASARNGGSSENVDAELVAARAAVAEAQASAPTLPRALTASPPAGTLLVRSLAHPLGRGDDGAFFRFDVAELAVALNGRPMARGVYTAGHVKGGEGACLRAKNLRTGREDAVLLWAPEQGDDAGLSTLGVGCWNPADYASAGDWMQGDLVSLMSLPLPPLKRRLPVARYEALSGTGWSLPGDFLAFGQCGLVGDYWRALRVELHLKAACALSGVLTDADADNCPTRVEVRDLDGNWAEPLYIAMPDPAGVFLQVVSRIGEPSVIAVDAVRLCWPSTDLHKSKGLSSARSGGGVHAELHGYQM